MNWNIFAHVIWLLMCFEDATIQTQGLICNPILLYVEQKIQLV